MLRCIEPRLILRVVVETLVCLTHDLEEVILDVVSLVTITALSATVCTSIAEWCQRTLLIRVVGRIQPSEYG